MSIELKTVMGQMNIVRGRWASKAPSILAVREPTSRLRGMGSRGDLFITLEIRGDFDESERDNLSQSLAETIRNTYYQSSGSITAGLRRAVLAANEQLLVEYVRSPDDEYDEEFSHRSAGSGLLAGVSAVAVRGEDVFIASVGPAITYAVTRGVVTQFPEASPWLDMADPQATGAPALGRRMGLDVQLFHAWVEPGDILVLGDSRFAMQTEPEQVEKAIAYQGVEGALVNLGKLTGGRDCTALVVEIQAKSKGPLRDEQKLSVPVQPTRGRDTVSAEAAPLPDTVSQAAEARRRTRVGVGRAAFQDVGRFRVQLPVGRWLGAIGKGLLALLMVIWTGLRTIITRVLPGQGRQPSARRLVATGQARSARTSLSPKGILRALAFVIPIVVLAAVGLTYWQRGLARENEYTALMDQAQNAYQQAQALGGDDLAARNLLDQAETALVQANAVKPGDTAISELRASVAERQDQINRVERLYWVGKLRSYDGSASQMRRVVVSGLYVYVLDVGADQVYHHRLDEANDALEPDEGDPVLVRRGQQVGEAVAGEMIDLVWMPAGGNRQTSDLLILESGGLLEYNPSWGLTSVPIANKDAWALPVAVGSYFGNFYVLDPQAGQILRYVPSTEDYNIPAEYYFSDQSVVDLSGAVDMAIDGSIYVLYADGTIRKFEAGLPVEFQVTELDKSLSRPTAIYAAPDDVAQYIYVADAGNLRVVQLNKDGRFVRQFKPQDEEEVNFKTLRSIFVDELTGKLYLLNDQALYIANITPLQ
ncbi:MAG: hypothetical protein JSV81_14380 [Anaerolineales bacterium]|nr:MAG: hypothetical protein JSV81_14380 [Anaerolineales bacterium]